ncbi:MAG: TIGR00159 family protein [candidate division Zixibacteria bacterium]|nr:TIGR00159 family protein [candidate division Zixibacteria bacterium]
MELFKIDFLSFRLVDLIDVAVVGFLIYKLFQLVRGTRSAHMMTGLAVTFLVAFVAYWFQLEALSWLFSNLTTFGLVALVILFQPELRSALANLGLTGALRVFGNVRGRQLVEEVARASLRLAELKYGGLIVIEGRVGLRDFAETGKEMNARISSEMLVTLFTPYTPLHDGAVIISGGQITSAACTLPLSQSALYRRLYGMRHKAGIGISEVSDAISIIVSEETGEISIASVGKLEKNIDRSEFREVLTGYLSK